jgi:adenylate cyclase
MQNKIFRALTANNFSRTVLLREAVYKSFTAGVDVDSPPVDQLRKLVGKTRKYSEEIGTHPDFEHLETGQTENGYAVTVFIDIKGSTKLATKLPLEDVRYLKNAIIKTAIGIFHAFDGHIHRIQGDAVMAYFRRNDLSKAQCIVDALNAATFLQAYITQELSPFFESQGYFPLKIRVGVDYGDDPVVLWSKYGILNCSEITTTSLHTDLAAKLQAEASANGVMIGDNVIKYLDFPEEFYNVRTHQENGQRVEDLYILDTGNVRYRMWQFDWSTYSKRFAVLGEDTESVYSSPEHFRIRCWHKPFGVQSFSDECFPNATVVPKQHDLKFVLETTPGVVYDDVEWFVINRGSEAAAEDRLQYEMTKYRGERSCLQTTQYKGHHYMRCTLYHENRIVAREHFGIYISD